MSALLPELESAVDAGHGLAAVAPDLDVLEGVAEGAAAAVAHGHVALHLDDGLPLDELEGVGPVLAPGVRGVGLGDHVLGLVVAGASATATARRSRGGRGQGTDRYRALAEDEAAAAAADTAAAQGNRCGG